MTNNALQDLATLTKSHIDFGEVDRLLLFNSVIAPYREQWQQVLFSEAIDYLSTDFAAGKTKNCKKGYSCGNGCISRTKKCRKKHTPDAQSAQDWLKTNGGGVAANTGTGGGTGPDTDLDQAEQERIAQEADRAIAERESASINQSSTVNASEILNDASLAERRALLVNKFGEERISEVEQNLQRLLDESSVHVAVPSDFLETIINDGRLKSSVELSEQKSSVSDKGTEYDDLRKKYESSMFGEKYDDLPASDRPIYGYFGESGGLGAESHEAPSRYGDVVLRLKDDAKDRTTSTTGDTFGGYSPSESKKVNAASLLSQSDMNDLQSGEDVDAIFNERFDTINSANSISDVTGDFNYIEAQVHGQVRMNQDIEEILVRNQSAITPSVREWADANNVKITVDESSLDGEDDDFFL